MEGNNTQETQNVWFVYDIDEGEEKRFFISPILKTPKEYNEVWQDTQEYKEKMFREFFKDDTPYEEFLYEALRLFKEPIELPPFPDELEIKSESGAKIQKNNISIDDDIPF